MFINTLSQLATSLSIAGTMALAAFGTAPAHAEAPFAKTSAPGYYRFMLGDFEVTALSDGTVALPADQLLSEAPAKTRAALARSFLSAPLETSVNAFLVNTGGMLVLIDVGAGALFGPTLGKMIANLKASGYEPGQIDEIYLTHIHPDHVGGLASNGSVAFPNALVRSDQKDADYWLSQRNLDQAPEASKGFFQGAMASLKPYVATGKFKPFTGDVPLAPGIASHATYGHTAGHTSYMVESKGQKLLLVGDLIHVPAVQLDAPGVTIAFDSDAKEAKKTRVREFDKVARDGVLIGAAHIQFPGLGHLRSSGKTYQWIPVNYTQMN
jgi:glyoxylase-like metal-dependent hydrolase (beta-lactamase superfamily II)